MATTQETESTYPTPVESPTPAKKERRPVPPPGRPGNFQEGLDLLVKKYDKALKELAK